MWRVFYRARMKKVTATVCNVSRVFYRAHNVARVLQGTDEESDSDSV